MNESVRQSPTINKLASKLATILGEVGKVPKSGHNSFHNYDYVTENDLVYAVRDKLATAGVFVFTSVAEQKVEIIKGDAESDSFFLTTVTTEHTFADGESGEWFTVRAQGQGSDKGDKGGYKAMTGAMKYFLYKCFMIPTGDDPEADEKTDKRGAESKGPKSSAPASTAGTGAKKADPEVPRSIPTDAQKALFRGNKWWKVAIHFGKQKSKLLSEVGDKSLTWWITEWQPKPYEGKFNDDDMLLRAALDVADEEWK